MENYELKLLKSFPNGFVNYIGEFIAEKKTNQYFNLGSCKDEFEVKCKVLEWLSRSACKAEPYKTVSKNDELHNYMLNGINRFLDTQFTIQDMETIYQYLGNQINRKRTERFIISGYDLKIFDEATEKE